MIFVSKSKTGIDIMTHGDWFQRLDAASELKEEVSHSSLEGQGLRQDLASLSSDLAYLVLGRLFLRVVKEIFALRVNVWRIGFLD